ncbi:MAG: transcriptional repressor [Nitrospinae bacterium]|nr:transcriptional repressor [Nitrospinota bacterium]
MQEAVRQTYQAYLTRHGLKSTVQREIIIKRFVKSRGHLSADELYAALREEHPSIGLATIYRTLKILTEAGIAREQRFNDGFTRYEFNGPDDRHHDHLVCTACGRVEEFENREIERLQEEVANIHGFAINDHKLELYGLCPDCARSGRNVG